VNGDIRDVSKGYGTRLTELDEYAQPIIHTLVFAENPNPLPILQYSEAGYFRLKSHVASQRHSV
jgi:hypothetical protein